MITRLQFEIPPTSILCGNLGNEDTQDGPSFKQERKFLFPAALSPSLRTVIILGTVIRIHEAVPQSQWTLKQDLFDPNSPHDPYETYLLRREILNRPRYPLSDILQPSQLPPDALEFLFHNWIRSVFSPCETYLFVIKGKSAPSADMFGTWILDVYQNADVSLNYQLIATSAIRFNHIPSNPILIHKTKPVLVISLLSITVMWRFTMKGIYHLSFAQLSYTDNIKTRSSSLCMRTPWTIWNSPSVGTFFMVQKLEYQTKDAQYFSIWKHTSHAFHK